MKVIFQEDVRGQAKKGEMKEVSDGYARNFLLPRGIALQATAESMNILKQQEKKKQRQIEKEKAEAAEIAARMDGLIVTIHAKAGESGRLFGAVTSKEISEALMQQHGVFIDKQKIVQAEPIKSFGNFELRCKLGHEIQGTLNVLVIEG
jgi:large subunit ribosomal protein L9